MDFARGSRRARQVASNAAQAEGQAPQARAQRQHQQQTPDAHRTPDQGDGDQHEAVAPPPNPFRIHRATRHTSTPRLSLTMDSDDSSSEPDLSVLGMARGTQRMAALSHGYGQRQRQVHQQDQAQDQGLEQEPEPEPELEELEEPEDEQEDVDESMYQYQAPSDADETGIEDQVDDEEGLDEVAPMIDPATAGLKEISNLGRFTVSSHKPGNGVEELRSDDLKSYWQSDGPQPHKLTIYFVKRVGIRDIRFYVDYTEDESYTPTKIVFRSGTSENNLIEFATMSLDSPVGWQQVPIAGAGGDPDGNTLVSYVLQMQVLENHQNGKDTHLRGIKIYAFDADAAQGAGHQSDPMDDVSDAVEGATLPGGRNQTADNSQRLANLAQVLAATRLEIGDGLNVPDFMREPELR